MPDKEISPCFFTTSAAQGCRIGFARALRVQDRPGTRERDLEAGEIRVGPYAGEIRDGCALRAAIGCPGCRGHRLPQGNRGQRRRQQHTVAQGHFPLPSMALRALAPRSSMADSANPGWPSREHQRHNRPGTHVTVRRARCKSRQEDGPRRAECCCPGARIGGPFRPRLRDNFATSSTPASSRRSRINVKPCRRRFALPGGTAVGHMGPCDL